MLCECVQNCVHAIESRYVPETKAPTSKLIDRIEWIAAAFLMRKCYKTWTELYFMCCSKKARENFQLKSCIIVFFNTNTNKLSTEIPIRSTKSAFLSDLPSDVSGSPKKHSFCLC